jgi:hypothetical protein
VQRQDYYSNDWGHATIKFVTQATDLGTVKWQKHPKSDFHIPYLTVGTGTDKIVINSGIHGAEAYLGSAAQILIMQELMPDLLPEFFGKYTLILIHVVNGWGMENGMREVMDDNGGLVDLNRNFGVDFSRSESLPKNPLYRQAHDLLLSSPKTLPGEKTKYRKILEFRKAHLADGVWASISRGQYEEPLGLFYGGSAPMPENLMTLAIYDEVMKNATSLRSVGLHTGVGRYYKSRGQTDANLLVSHPASHENTREFARLTGNSATLVPYDGPMLIGDLVDALESRYARMNIPIYTADFEIGTDEAPVRSPVLRFMDRGNARYEMIRTKKLETENPNPKKIKAETSRNLLKGWYYADDPVWKKSALDNSHRFFQEFFRNLQKAL